MPKRGRTGEIMVATSSVIPRPKFSKVRLVNFKNTRPRVSSVRHTEELKVVDTALATYQVNTTGSFTLLNGTQLGTDFTNRIGRKIVCKSVFIRGAVYHEGATVVGALTPAFAVNRSQCRMILFVDMQPNGAVPVVTDLLNTARPEEQLNLNNRDRFRVLADKTFFLDPMVLTPATTPTAAAWGRTGQNVKLWKKLNLETIYNAGNAGTIGDINSGALYMFWISQSAAGTNTDQNALLTVRLRFSDP